MIRGLEHKKMEGLRRLQGLLVANLRTILGDGLLSCVHLIDRFKTNKEISCGFVAWRNVEVSRVPAVIDPKGVRLLTQR